jgi:MYXO-CTERM domain-containing protein
MLTEYSGAAAAAVVKRWQKLGQELLLKYLDGNVRDAEGKVTHPPYPEEYYRMIAKARPGHFELPEPDELMTDAQRRARKLPPAARPAVDATPVPPVAPAPCSCKKEGGCGCAVVGGASPRLPVFAALPFIVLALLLRRRRR